MPKWCLFLTGASWLGLAYMTGAVWWLYLPGLFVLLVWLLVIGAANMDADASGFGSGNSAP